MKNIKPVILGYKKPRDTTARVMATRTKRQVFHDKREARGGAGAQVWLEEWDDDWDQEEPMQFRAPGKSGGFFFGPKAGKLPSRTL